LVSRVLRLPVQWTETISHTGSFFNGVFLLALALSIFLQALERFVNVQPVDKPVLILIVGCIGLTLNILSVWIVHGDGLLTLLGRKLIIHHAQTTGGTHMVTLHFQMDQAQRMLNFPMFAIRMVVHLFSLTWCAHSFFVLVSPLPDDFNLSTPITTMLAYRRRLLAPTSTSLEF